MMGSGGLHFSLGLLGCATLLPWNVVITELQFFSVRAQQQPTFQHIAEDFKAVVPVSFQCTYVANAYCMK